MDAIAIAVCQTFNHAVWICWFQRMPARRPENKPKIANYYYTDVF